MTNLEEIKTMSAHALAVFIIEDFINCENAECCHCPMKNITRPMDHNFDCHDILENYLNSEILIPR